MVGPTADRARIGPPERWLFCPKMGKIIDDLFVPFKTPLCGLYDDQLDPRFRFHPEDVFKSPELKGKKIGLWCDFTKTDRFYFTHEVENHGCIYKKIQMEGHGASPSKEQVDEFITVVQNFVRTHPGQLVAVHCTHGFNRTGFAISSYLVTVKDMAVDYAIQLFAAQRSCGIYKQDYINDLFERYGDMEDCIEAPEKPRWEYDEEDNSLDFTSNKGSNGGPSGSDGAGSSQKLFMDGQVKNVYWVDDYSKKQMLRGKIKDLCMARREGFPGLQPVSMRHDNMRLLSENRYLVSWKADGMRYMVYIMDQDEVYAFDRDNEVFYMEGLDFRHRKEDRSVRNTLVDAEMIIDKHTIDGRETITPRLLIYDIIQFEDIYIGKQSYNIRRNCIDNELIRPRKVAMQAGRLREQPMSVRIKDFWELVAVPKLFSTKFTQNLGHEIDGLIFQPIDLPYTAGRCDKVLKWKPPSHNSVDFLLNIRKEQRPGLLAEWVGYLYVQNKTDPVGKMKATKTLQKYDNKIIECTLDVRKREWVFMRERTDKSLPNGLRTYESVLESMLNPVTKEHLIDFVNHLSGSQRHNQSNPQHHHHQQGGHHNEQPERKRPRTDY